MLYLYIMKTINIANKEKAILGETTVISKGINMVCKPIITKSIIHKNMDGFYIINNGISILIDEKDLQEFYINTKENRKLLKLTF